MTLQRKFIAVRYRTCRIINNDKWFLRTKSRIKSGTVFHWWENSAHKLIAQYAQVVRPYSRWLTSLPTPTSTPNHGPNRRRYGDTEISCPLVGILSLNMLVWELVSVNTPLCSQNLSFWVTRLYDQFLNFFIAKVSFTLNESEHESEFFLWSFSLLNVNIKWNPSRSDVPFAFTAI